MSLQFLIDILSGNLVLVDVNTTPVVPPTPSYFIPVFFNLIPQ
jgi:hypothetical protein